MPKKKNITTTSSVRSKKIPKEKTLTVSKTKNNIIKKVSNTNKKSKSKSKTSLSKTKNVKSKQKLEKLKNDVSIPTEGFRRILVFDVGIRNLGYLLGTCENKDDFNIEEWKVIDILKESGDESENANKVNVDILTLCMLKFLIKNMTRWSQYKIDAIIIEIQVKSRLQCLAVCIHSFFETYYSFFGDSNLKPKIGFQSGKMKLKVKIVSDYSSIKLNNAEIKKLNSLEGYEENKYYTVVYTRLFLLAYPKCKKWSQFYINLKKKDDGCDALFHFLFFCLVGSNKLTVKKKKELTDENGYIILKGRKPEPITISFTNPFKKMITNNNNVISTLQPENEGKQEIPKPNQQKKQEEEYDENVVFFDLTKIDTIDDIESSDDEDEEFLTDTE